MQIAIVLYPGFTALDFIGPYESLRWLPDAEPVSMVASIGTQPERPGVGVPGDQV